MKLPHLNTPAIFIILGATGDLSKKKIIPALWQLFNDNLLPDRCSVLGFADTSLSQEEFQKYIKENLKEKMESFSAEKFNSFLNLFTYISGKFDDEISFRILANQIYDIEKKWSVCSNKVFFLAASPTFYELIFTNLAKTKLNIPCGGELGWTRILIEKPFGYDLASSRKLQNLLLKYFKEEQIYRIDHYLAKEIVQGISNFRFSNNLFESSWNNSLIEKIEIRLFETVGLEERGSFYDALGAFVDVGQNHLLELLSLITMKAPEREDAFAIRKNRADILKNLKPWTKKDVIENTYRAQYKSYKDIEGVKKDSKTETFFALKTELQDSLWHGVSITVEAGKQCSQVLKEIVVTLKEPIICFLCRPGEYNQNQIVFQIDPEGKIVIKFWAKKTGYGNDLEEKFFTFFLYKPETKIQYVEEYAKLLYEAVVGDQTLFVSSEEVEALWRFADPIENIWKKNLVPLEIYEKGTTPKAKFIESSGVQISKIKKQIGFVGLGKMGANLARRLVQKGWIACGFDSSLQTLEKFKKEGMIGASSLHQLVEKVSSPRIIWLMIPAGATVDEVLFGKDSLVNHLNKGDIIIDGGNSFYKDSVRRFKKLKEKGINFVDVGVSGGLEGARHGASLMIGGEYKTFKKLEELFKDLAKEHGYQFFDGPGAGHFAKMIHNGIEYGMMQAIAEGFTILKKSNYKLNLSKLADVYNHGSVIESRLVGWLKQAFLLHGQDLKGVKGQVAHTGEGDWTLAVAKEIKIKAKVIEEALRFRINSAKNPNYTGQILSALREQFGGHNVK